MSRSKLVTDILAKRGIVGDDAEEFLNPSYGRTNHDPFLLPDMQAAVDRLVQAQKKHEKVVIYGDYDIDGISATAILVDSFEKFGFDVSTYTPDRFTEGYGLNEEAMRTLAESGAQLVVTVDCGSLSHKEVEVGNELGMDTIITDHHAVAETMPPAVATINAHRADSQYPFPDLAGCGIAFKLVQALQTRLSGLPVGQEKWLLDLFALGTVCDIVRLRDENRNNVYWGMEVIKKTRRVGLRALMAVANVRPEEIDSRKIGFALGPRLNAAGRLDTARYALDLLLTDSKTEALGLAQKLEELNKARRAEQDRIFAGAVEKADCNSSNVLVVADKSWNEGVIGIVASKLVEKYTKPSFVLSVGESHAKGSGRSFGDFSLAKAIAATRPHLIKGGGHAAAGGVTIALDKMDDWVNAINGYYDSLGLQDQGRHLLVDEDVSLGEMSGIDEALVGQLAQLEPFGMGNEKPVFCLRGVVAKYVDRIGKEKNHLKMTIGDAAGRAFKFIAFGAPERWFVDQGSRVSVWVNLEINEWNGNRSVEGKILRLEEE
jgi:single-stranded-DNA-specific exonuclease